jgi:hypothetical protein
MLHLKLDTTLLTGVLQKGKSKSPLPLGEGYGEGFVVKKVLPYLFDIPRPSPPAPLPKGKGRNLQNSSY